MKNWNEKQHRFDAFYQRMQPRAVEGDRISLDYMRESIIGLNPQVITDCPCCTQRVKLYKRNLTIQLARTLVSLAKVTRFVWDGGIVKTEIRRTPGKGVYVHWRAVVSDAARGGAACSLLQHFGLISSYDTKSTVKGSQGFWAITKEGLQFVDRKLRVPQAVYIYDNVCFGFSKESILIDDVKGFNYMEEVSGR